MGVSHPSWQLISALSTIASRRDSSLSERAAASNNSSTVISVSAGNHANEIDILGVAPSIMDCGRDERKLYQSCVF